MQLTAGTVLGTGLASVKRGKIVVEVGCRRHEAHGNCAAGQNGQVRAPPMNRIHVTETELRRTQRDVPTAGLCLCLITNRSGIP
jgi:hypothetical protein